MVDKLEKDGKVAVLYSPSYGAGWSTWNTETRERMVFDPVLAKLVLDNKPISVQKAWAEERYPGCYTGGISDGLEVEWLPKGKKFYIDEYDGAESVITDENPYMTA